MAIINNNINKIFVHDNVDYKIIIILWLMINVFLYNDYFALF